MPRRPLVSVIILTHDRESFLSGCLENVLGQDFADREVIIVDDASADRTAEVAGAFIAGRPGWTYRRSPRRLGPAGARNLGLTHARGQLVAFLDSDDLWCPGKLDLQAARFSDRRVQAVYCDFDLIDERGAVLERRCLRTGRRSRLWRDPYDALTGLKSPRPSTLMLRREAVRALGGFDTHYRRLCDDIDLCLRLLVRHGPGSFFFIDAALARYRVHPGQQTRFSRPTREALQAIFPGVDGGPRRLARPAARELECVLDFAYFNAKHAGALFWLYLRHLGCGGSPATAPALERVRRRLLAHAEADAAFRAELLRAPHAALRRGLGLSVPRGLTLRVTQSRGDEARLTLPPAENAS